MLKVDGIHTFYGLSHILQGVSLEVQAGEIICLLGRNGVGKTTTLKSIIGLTPPRNGKVIFKGEEIQGKDPMRSPGLELVMCLKIEGSFRCSQ